MNIFEQIQADILVDLFGRIGQAHHVCISPVFLVIQRAKPGESVSALYVILRAKPEESVSQLVILIGAKNLFQHFVILNCLEFCFRIYFKNPKKEI